MRLRTSQPSFALPVTAAAMLALLLNATHLMSSANNQMQTQQTQSEQTQSQSRDDEESPVQTRSIESRSSQKVGPVLHLQVLLDRAGFSPGQIDGRMGHNTLKALNAFQEANELPVTDGADKQTLQRLQENEIAPLVEYQVTEIDVAGPFAEKIPDDMMQKAELSEMRYTSVLESLGEKFHARPELIRDLNTDKNFSAGEWIVVPNVLAAEDNPSRTQSAEAAQIESNPAAHIVVVSEESSELSVFDKDQRVIFFAPVTAGSKQDPLPLGTWKVTGVARNPEFLYNPELFWDSDPEHAKAKIAPGPNNPVGVVWIDINVEHYGIHGSPEPGRIGYEESHGCVRMTNWDALRLTDLVRPGTKVIFEK